MNSNISQTFSAISYSWAGRDNESKRKVVAVPSAGLLWWLPI